MLDAKAFANAVTAVSAVFYVVCALLSFAFPDLIFNIGQSWMHTINLGVAKASYSPNLTLFVFGLVSLAVVSWITTYATVVLYNTWKK